MPECLHYLEMKEVKEKKRGGNKDKSYKALWSNLNCGKGERHKPKQEKKNAQNLIIHFIYDSEISFNP